MGKKYIVGGFIIVVFLGLMAFLFTQTNIKYEEDFASIKSTTATVKATGSWVKHKNYHLDTENRPDVLYSLPLYK